MRFLKLNDNLKDCTLLVYQCTNGHNYPIPSIIKVKSDIIYSYYGIGISPNSYKIEIFNLNNDKLSGSFNTLSLTDVVILDNEDIKNIKYLINNVLPTLIERLPKHPNFTAFCDNKNVCQLYMTGDQLNVFSYHNIVYDYNPTVNCQIASIRGGNILVSKSKEEIANYFLQIGNTGFLKNQALFDLNESYFQQLVSKFDSSEIVFTQHYVSTNKSKMVMCLINIVAFINNNQKLFNTRVAYNSNQLYNIPTLGEPILS